MQSSIYWADKNIKGTILLNERFTFITPVPTLCTAAAKVEGGLTTLKIL